LSIIGVMMDTFTALEHDFVHHRGDDGHFYCP
jgi:hypothetical protein